jgi:hypothetical protein
VGARYGARRNGSAPGSIIVSNIDANKLFNGGIFPASLDRFQNSHACPPRRYHAAVDRTARAALCSLMRRARAVRFFAAPPLWRRLYLVRAPPVFEFSRDGRPAFPSPVYRGFGVY